MSCIDVFKDNCREVMDDSDPEKIVKANKLIMLAAKISNKFPLVFLPDFLDEFMKGMFTKKMVKKYHILREDEFQVLVGNMLKMTGPRSKDPNLDNMVINMENKEWAKQYELLSEQTKLFHVQLMEMLNCNILRAILVHTLFENEFVAGNDIEDLIRSSYVRLTDKINLLSDMSIRDSFESYLEMDLVQKIFLIATQLDKELYITSMHGDFSIPDKYSKIKEFIYERIQDNADGVSYSIIRTFTMNRLPLLKLALNSNMFDKVLDDLEEDNKIIRKRSFWRYAPYSDQFYTVENYENILKSMRKQMISMGRTKFFGRRITPDQFIDELKSLEPGDLYDQDDQVTRIAGLVLSDSALLQSPREDTREFDFMVDLSKYNFRPEQEKLMKDIGFQAISDKFHCKVMINDEMTKKILEHLRKSTPANEQTVVFTCRPVKPSVLEMTRVDPIVQIIDETTMRKWSEITPIIPCRRNSIARIMYGDAAAKLVQIISLNYESGRAVVKVIPDVMEITVPIGSLEEINLHASDLDDFDHITRNYAEFLQLLSDLAPNTFEDGLGIEIIRVHNSHYDLLRDIKPELFEGIHPAIPQSEPSPSGSMYVQFENVHVIINLGNSKNMFSCSCNHRLNEIHYRTLCPHEIAALNYICTVDALDLKTSKIYMSKIMRGLASVRESNVRKMSSTIHETLSSMSRTGFKPQDTFIEYLQRHTDV